MTLTVTLELPPTVEAQVRDGLARHDAGQVRQLLLDALAPTVEALLQQPPAPLLDDAEWADVADELANTFMACVTANTPMLSEYAISRAGIYEEHP